MKEAARIQLRVASEKKLATQAPTAPAAKWLARVAATMPAMIGHGLRKRAASRSASNWVLSPISARGNDEGRDEQRFHQASLRGGSTNHHDTRHLPPRVRSCVS